MVKKLTSEIAAPVSLRCSTHARRGARCHSVARWHHEHRMFMPVTPDQPSLRLAVSLVDNARAYYTARSDTTPQGPGTPSAMAPPCQTAPGWLAPAGLGLRLRGWRAPGRSESAAPVKGFDSGATVVPTEGGG